MIRSGARAIGRLVDRMASNLGDARDVSHLVDVRPLRSSEIDVVSSRLNPARNAATHESRLKLQNDGILVYLIAWIDEVTGWARHVAMGRPDRNAETTHRNSVSVR